jgi:hypothetical protein
MTVKSNWRVIEPAAVHSGLPVKRGRKLTGTLWIHALGFRVPELYAGRDCHPPTFYVEQLLRGDRNHYSESSRCRSQSVAIALCPHPLICVAITHQNLTKRTVGVEASD